MVASKSIKSRMYTFLGLTIFPLEVDMVTSKSIKSRMYTFSPMMVSNSRKHHCRVRPYTREVLVISTNLDIQKNHYPLDFTNRRGVEARIKNTWYNQGSKDLSRVGSNKWYQSLLRVSHKKNIPRSKILFRPHNHTPLYSFKMAGSDNDSDDASAHSEATIPQQQQNIQPQIITTVSNNNAKFPYLKKDDLKRTGRDHDGRVIILPPTTADEHIAVQRESKARTTLLQSIPDDHVADFHYMDDARDIWSASQS
ncbi:hypothetical protein Tco_0271556 [Tanacetum coccineum]